MRLHGRACLCLALLSAWTAAAQPSDAELAALSQPVARDVSKSPWMQLHERYVGELEGTKRGVTPQTGLPETVYDFVMYGDSIFEAFRGNSFGRAARRFRENRLAWEALFQPNYNATVFAVSGDRCAHLLWRVENQEGPMGISTKLIVALIGTNDVNRFERIFRAFPGAPARAIFLGAKMVHEELERQAPEAKQLVISLPPLQVQPEFNLKYQPVVDETNALLQQFAAERPGYRFFVDCATPMMIPGTRNLNQTLMPDGVHPMGAGAWVWATCLKQAIDSVLGQVQPAPGNAYM